MQWENTISCYSSHGYLTVLRTSGTNVEPKTMCGDVTLTLCGLHVHFPSWLDATSVLNKKVYCWLLSLQHWSAQQACFTQGSITVSLILENASPSQSPTSGAVQFPYQQTFGTRPIFPNRETLLAWVFDCESPWTQNQAFCCWLLNGQ